MMKDWLIGILLLSSMSTAMAFPSSIPVAFDYYLNNKSCYPVTAKIPPVTVNLDYVQPDKEAHMAKLNYPTKAQINETIVTVVSKGPGGKAQDLCKVMFRLYVRTMPGGAEGLSSYVVDKDKSTVESSNNTKCSGSIESGINTPLRGVIVVHKVPDEYGCK